MVLVHFHLSKIIHRVKGCIFSVLTKHDNSCSCFSTTRKEKADYHNRQKLIIGTIIQRFSLLINNCKIWLKSYTRQLLTVRSIFMLQSVRMVLKQIGWDTGTPCKMFVVDVAEYDGIWYYRFQTVSLGGQTAQ